MDSTGEDSSHEGKQAEKEEEEEEEGEAGAGREGEEEPREAEGSAEVVVEEEEEEEEEEIDVALIRNMTQKLSTEPVKVRVHDVQIKGNTRTKDSVIEAQLKEVRSVETMQELLQESVRANARLRALGIFDKCVITLDAGPNELPGTANVIVEVEEAKRPFTGDLGVFSKPETKAWSLEGTVKYKNLAGYGETLDATGCYGLDTTSELSAGVTYPRFKGWKASLATRVTLLTQDWQRYSSYHERLTGLSVGLVSDKNHDISYNLTWRDLKDPSRSASKSIRRQLGHSLLSSVKYTYKKDQRDSVFRPRRGMAFISTSQIAGLGPDSKLLRFARQEVEVRMAVPLGFANAALNFGVAGGIIIPWGKGFQSKATPISDRFFMGGHTSLLGELKGPSSLLGFRTRGVGPSEFRRSTSVKTTEIGEGEKVALPKRDTLGGDLAVSGFADFSFDLPLAALKEYGIHVHTFACTGNLVPLTGENRQPWSLAEFISGFRCSTGLGLVIPTKLFRLEVNYCYLLRYQENDRIKRGFQISLSSPH
ncbi:unnamed protein product [Sphagnum jensenii]|uniref:Bacterial surface antigen (D15) domain-containing protein n=1 Tax=Sphagnum jensenii TaxID=128206 RepID=A0ABP1AMP2_9BRYO